VADRLDSHTNRFPSIETCLKRLMRRCRVPSCDCEDCIQEARLALLNAHPDWTLEEPRTIAWLFAVARNKARDFHRARKRHRVEQLNDLSPILVSNLSQTSPEIAQDGQHHEGFLKLQDTLNRLSEVNRQILIQRAVQERTYQQFPSWGFLFDRLLRLDSHFVKPVRAALLSRNRRIDRVEFWDSLCRCPVSLRHPVYGQCHVVLILIYFHQMTYL
jgi:RNA polymerase sigma factor (sigma-70 family)